MSIEQLSVEKSALQDAIYRVALSLDSVLVNGIPMGVLQHSALPGFLDKVAGNLISDLARLEEQVHASSVPVLAQVQNLLTTLRTECSQLVDLVKSLRLFPSLPSEQLRLLLTRIPLQRDAAVRLIQELENELQTPTPFYPNRPVRSQEAVTDFLDNLDRLFATGKNAESD